MDKFSQCSKRWSNCQTRDEVLENLQKQMFFPYKQIMIIMLCINLGNDKGLRSPYYYFFFGGETKFLHVAFKAMIDTVILDALVFITSQAELNLAILI